MRPAEIAITRILRSRWCNLLLMGLAMSTVFMAGNYKPLALTLADRGLIFNSPARWFGDSPANLALALGANIAIVLMMVYVNRRFNLLRTMSLIFVAMFMVMEAATPSTLMWFGGGQMAAIVMLWALSIFYSAYNRPRRMKRIFLAFTIVTAASTMQYGFLIYLPVLLVGCVQMRVFHFRSFLAALIGIITPPWIIFGLGIADFSDFRIPHPTTIFSGVDPALTATLLATVALTMLAGTVAGAANLLKVMSLNARTRAINGLLTTIGIVTALAAVVDISNIEFYIPLLNVTTAFQVGLFCRLYTSRRAYLMELCLIAAYATLLILSNLPTA